MHRRRQSSAVLYFYDYFALKGVFLYKDILFNSKILGYVICTFCEKSTIVFRHCLVVYFSTKKSTKSRHSPTRLFEVVSAPWRHIARNSSFRRPTALTNRSLTVCTSASEVIATTRRLSIVPTAKKVLYKPYISCVALKYLLVMFIKTSSKLILTQAYTTFCSNR